MENEKILNSLAEIGLEKKPARVYLATLEIGGGTASVISKRAGIERVNTYYILEQLAMEGLVYTAEKEGKRFYVAHSPKKLVTMAEDRLHQAKILIPELLSYESANEVRPKVKIFEGVEGIKEVFNETLLLPRDSETLAFASYGTVMGNLKDFIPDYIRRRAAKGITQRLIAEETPESREYLWGTDKKDLRESRLVSKEKYPIKVDQINIFGNKMFIASMSDMLALVVESKPICDSFRALFELAWEGAEKYQKK